MTTLKDVRLICSQFIYQSLYCLNNNIMINCNLLNKLGLKMEQKRERGRPPKNGKAMTAAERQRRWREQARIKTVSVKVSEKTDSFLDKYCELTDVSKPNQIASIAEAALADWAEDAERRWPEIVAMMARLNEKKG